MSQMPDFTLYQVLSQQVWKEVLMDCLIKCLTPIAIILNNQARRNHWDNMGVT